MSDRTGPEGRPALTEPLATSAVPRPATGGDDRRGPSLLRRGVHSPLLGFALILVLLGVWELLAVTETLSPLTWPPISTILGTFIAQLVALDLLRELWITTSRLLIGFAVASLIGVVVGVLMGSIRWVDHMLDPLTEFLRPIPVSALVPVAILFFGLGGQMKVAMVIYAALWPILINTYSGVRWVDPVLINTGRTFGLSKLQILVHIRLRAAAPYIATGMRVSLAVALVVAVVAEMIAGGDGIGSYLLQRQRTFRIPEMYGGIISLALLGYLLNVAFVFVQKKLLFWTEEQAR